MVSFQRILELRDAESKCRASQSRSANTYAGHLPAHDMIRVRGNLGLEERRGGAYQRRNAGLGGRSSGSVSARATPPVGQGPNIRTLSGGTHIGRANEQVKEP
jgi:hypothetical protein